MSPRAACRLAHLGYSPVYDYAAGKMDWLSFALPHDGEATLAAAVADRDLPTCGIDTRVGEARARAERADANFCVVLHDSGVVMGLAQGEALQADPATPVEEVMDFGITTVRPAEEVDVLLERMRKAHVEAILVTRSDGTLFGLLTATQAQRSRARAGLSTPR